MESFAEHIYGTQMLAIHELGETIIGDLTQFQISKEEKKKIEYEEVQLECDLQCKLYDEENCVDINKKNNNILEQDRVKGLIEIDEEWSSMWIKFD